MPSSMGKEQQSVLGSTAAAFASCPQIGLIVIAVQDGEEDTARSCLPHELAASKGRVIFATGGPSRRSSVHNALLRLKEYEVTHVLIHDGARPWIKKPLIEKIIEGTIRHGATIPVLPLVETPKELEASAAGLEGKFIKAHLRREALCTAQTPQGFSYPEILNAHEKAAEREEREGFEYTDDAEVWGEFIGQVAVIPGDQKNKKITYPEDLK